MKISQLKGQGTETKVVHPVNNAVVSPISLCMPPVNLGNLVSRIRRRGIAGVSVQLFLVNLVCPQVAVAAEYVAIALVKRVEDASGRSTSSRTHSTVVD